MADLQRQFLNETSKKEVREARQARRTARQSRIYDNLRESVAAVTKFAQAFDIRETIRGDVKIESDMHPGDAGVSLVHGILSEYSIPAEIRLRYAGIDRKAGKGGHGISEGVIYIDAELKPVAGMTSHFSVPVIVRNARMQYPVVITTQEGPRVIAQSTFDDLLGRVEISQEDVMPLRAQPIRMHASKETSGLREEIKSALRGWRK